MLTKLFRALLLCCSLFAPFSASAEIIEIESIASLQNYVEKEDLVFLNVGETLFSPSCMLADNQWRIYFVECVNELVPQQEIAQAIIDEVKGWVVETVPKTTPESITPIVVADLQNQQISVLGYTQRQIATTYAPHNGLIVSRHLLSMGIDLEKSITYFNILPYSNEKHEFKYGIIFTNKHPVGPAVVELVHNLALSLPLQVIMVDDDLEVLKETEGMLNSSNIAFVGLRYSRTDARKIAFDSDIANIQFFSFMNENKLLSDAEALSIRTRTSEVDYQAKLNGWIGLRALQLSH